MKISESALQVERAVGEEELKIVCDEGSAEVDRKEIEYTPGGR